MPTVEGEVADTATVSTVSSDLVSTALADTATVSTVSNYLASIALADTTAVTPAVLIGLSGTASESLSVGANLDLVLHLMQQEEIRISVSEALSLIFSVELQQFADFLDNPTRAHIESVSDSVGVSESAAGLLAALLTESVGISLATAVKAVFDHSYSEALELSDTAARAFAANVISGVALSSAVLSYAYPTASILDSLTVQDALTPTFSLAVVAEESLEISDDQLLNFVFSADITDEVDITAAFSAGDNLIAWAVNTRTGSISNYLNFPFNSFGAIGSRYYAASKTGLYELTGDDDDSTDIISTIRSGFHQFGGPYLTSLDAAYLGVRGDGEYILKIITADGKLYTYTVNTESMRTAKVKMGRGMNSRYVSFELVSSGQDFDLESIEFKPVVLSRRV